jgi:hypothetical protein
MSALAALLVIAPQVFAQSDCQAAFEKWAKVSKTRLRAPPAGDERGACLQSETVRKELLEELARNRAICEGDPSWLDQIPQQTKMMIDINENFVRSLNVCPKESADVGTGWDSNLSQGVSKMPAPSVAAPKITPPTVVAPKMAAPTVVAPKMAAPAVVAPKVAAPTEVAPKVAAPTEVAPKMATPKSAAPAHGCLKLERAERYSLVNHCAGQTVLAVVETRDTSGRSACKAYSVSGAISLGNDKTVDVKVNHECVLNRGSCTSKHVGSMFPECDW